MKLRNLLSIPIKPNKAKVISPLLFENSQAKSQIKPFVDNSDGGQSAIQFDAKDGVLAVKGKVHLDRDSDMLKDGVYSGIKWEKGLSLEGGYDCIQLEIRNGGSRLVVECREEYDNFVIQWQAFLVDQTKKMQVLELPLPLFSISKNKRQPQLVYSQMQYRDIHNIEYTSLLIYSHEPGDFQFDLKRVQFVSRGATDITKLLKNYRRPYFLHKINYKDLSVLNNGREVLQLTR